MNKEKTLTELAIMFNSDKHGHHDYCTHYETHLQHLKNKHFPFVELGVGGYRYNDKGGSGLQMWGHYFKKATIAGVDLYDKSGLKIILPPNVELFRGSQTDENIMFNVFEKIGTPEVIIDDASHVNPLTIKTFEMWFPELAAGGIYVIEDLESSWWDNDEFKGCMNPTDMRFPSAINLVRELMNDLMHKHIGHYHRKYPIKAIHLYDNIVFIIKE